jgi:hypothetical protein
MPNSWHVGGSVLEGASVDVTDGVPVVSDDVAMVSSVLVVSLRCSVASDCVESLAPVGVGSDETTGSLLADEPSDSEESGVGSVGVAEEVSTELELFELWVVAPVSEPTVWEGDKGLVAVGGAVPWSPHAWSKQLVTSAKIGRCGRSDVRAIVVSPMKV